MTEVAYNLNLHSRLRSVFASIKTTENPLLKAF